MGEIGKVSPVKLFCGIIFPAKTDIAAVKDDLRKLFGGIDHQSEVFPFNYTVYYADEMGEGLSRQFVSFSGLIDPGRLAEIKIRTNELEEKYADKSSGRIRRVVNLDPGYVTQASLILATTKNFSHRIYLKDGIYAEVTMMFRKGDCVYFDWTYPDYKSEGYKKYFLHLRSVCTSG